MDTCKAVCWCKDMSESDHIVAIRQTPLEHWGFFTWISTILLVLVTGGGWLPFVVGWVLGRYWLSPTYRCQHCNAKIEKEQFRA